MLDQLTDGRLEFGTGRSNAYRADARAKPVSAGV